MEIEEKFNVNGVCEAKPPGILNNHEKKARPTTGTFLDVLSHASGLLSVELATHDSDCIFSSTTMAIQPNSADWMAESLTD